MISEDFYKNNIERHTLEVCLVLFKKCNLNCQFCFQDRYKDIDTEYIHNIPDRIERDLKDLVIQRRYNSVIYRIWGGEVFSDDVSDDIFSVYKQLVLDLNSLGIRIGINSQFCFSSNLVFTKTERVIKLIKETNSIIATSYDPIYRFQNKDQLNIWKHNILLFKPSSVSITLTKQNINEYIKNKEHLEFLMNYQVNIEYYIYNKRYEFFKPSEDDLYNFYYYCIKNNYYNISEVKLIVDSYRNKNGRYCTCNNSCLYLNGRLTFNCLKRSSNLPILDFFDNIPVETKYTEHQLKTAISRKHCLSCKNYSFCRMYCMASVLHKSYNPNNCALYRIYDLLGEWSNNENQ